MTPVTFSVERLIAMARPAGYVAELSACAVERTETTMTFEQDSACYRALKAKYAAYQPTAEEQRRAQQYEQQHLRAREQLIRQNQAGVAQVARSSSGCSGCPGRKITR